MDDLGGEEVFFDGRSLWEKPSDDKRDASLVFALEKETVPLPIMNRPGIFPAVVLWEFRLLDDLLGDEVQVGNPS